MKVFVITNDNGDVIGSMRPSQNPSPGAPIPGRPIPQNGQHLHEIELPSHLEHVTSADILHQEFKKLIQQQGGDSYRFQN